MFGTFLTWERYLFIFCLILGGYVTKESVIQSISCPFDHVNVSKSNDSLSHWSLLVRLLSSMHVSCDTWAKYKICYASRNVSIVWRSMLPTRRQNYSTFLYFEVLFILYNFNISYMALTMLIVYLNVEFLLVDCAHKIRGANWDSRPLMKLYISVQINVGDTSHVILFSRVARDHMCFAFFSWSTSDWVDVLVQHCDYLWVSHSEDFCVHSQSYLFTYFLCRLILFCPYGSFLG